MSAIFFLFSKFVIDKYKIWKFYNGTMQLLTRIPTRMSSFLWSQIQKSTIFLENTDGGMKCMPQCPLWGAGYQVPPWFLTSHPGGCVFTCIMWVNLPVYWYQVYRSNMLIYTWSYSSRENQNTIKSGLKYFSNCVEADAKMKSHFVNIPRRAFHCQNPLYLDMSLNFWRIDISIPQHISNSCSFTDDGNMTVAFTSLCFLQKNKSA